MIEWVILIRRSINLKKKQCLYNGYDCFNCLIYYTFYTNHLHEKLHCIPQPNCLFCFAFTFYEDEHDSSFIEFFYEMRVWCHGHKQSAILSNPNEWRQHIQWKYRSWIWSQWDSLVHGGYFQGISEDFQPGTGKGPCCMCQTTPEVPH